MSPVDRAWLLMDRPTNLMMIVGLLVLSERLALADLRRIIAERFLSFERFRQIPLNDALGARWQGAEQFDLGDHVLRAALPAPGGKAELEALAGDLASTPFNAGRPLWTFHLVEQYQGGSALIVRIHHCYADGIALLHVLLRLADASSAASPSPGAARAVPAAGAAADAASTTAGTAASTGLLPALLAQTLRGSAELLEKGVHLALHPGELSAAARQAVGVASEVANIGVLLPDDPPTRLRQALSGTRRVAWAEPLALQEVHMVGRVLGCTVNDVLVSTLAGALGRYLEAVGDDTAGLTLRATVPVNLRADAASQLQLGNRFGLVFVDLPVGVRHPLQRLYAVHESMEKLKGSPQAMVTLGLLSLVGSLNLSVEETAIGLFSAKASLVASSLRGPEQALRLAGAPISQLLFWVPQAGSIGTGVSMLTYRGEVQFGVIADRHLVPDPGRLVGLVQAEFDRLLYLVLLGADVLQA
jgi:WS/DGAT/MGAT family acyltransferase